MKNLIEEHFIANKDRLRVRDEPVNGSWIAINRGKLTAYANRRLQNWEDAEDAVQESYSRALQFIPSFNKSLDFDNWFFIVLTNVVNDMIRNKGSAPEMVEADDNTLTSEEFIAPAEEPFHFMLYSEQDQRMSKVCSQLSDRDASILSLYYSYGHSAPGIATLLGVNIATVNRVIFVNKGRILKGGKL
jgi:RNA polymerase sigma-70 factor (ECF subfamily)